MEKKIEDYAHLYIGSSCIWSRRKGDIKKECIITVSDLPWLRSMPVFKPILRPLSDMTEEEAEEINAELGSNHLANNLKDKSYYAMNVHVQFDLTFRLLRMGFDLFGLIDSGLAIDKSKL